MTTGIDPMAQLFDPQLMAQYRAMLEPPQEAKRAAGMDALLALGLGLLGNRSPHLGVAVGNAGVGAMGAYKSGMDSARANRMGELQGAMGLRKLQKDMEQEAKINELKAQVPQNELLYFEANPSAYIAAKMEALKPTDIERLGRVGGFTPAELSKAARVKGGLEPEPKAAGKSPLGELWAEFHSYPVGSPERASIMRRIQKEESHAPGASFSVGLQSPIIMQNPDGSYSMMQPTTKPGYDPQVTQFPPGAKPAPPAGGDKLTETEAKGSVFFKEMQDSEKLISGLVTKGLNPAAPKNQIAMRMAGSDWTNWMTPAEIQQYWASAERWAESFLRIKTGQAATEGEVRRNARMFFPQPGDKPEDVKFKETMRRQAVESVKVVAGRGAEKVNPSQGAAGSAPQPQKSITVDW